MIVRRHLALALLVCSASVPLFAQSQPAPPAAAPKPAAEPPLRRWFEIQQFMLATRYLFIENNKNVTTLNQQQYRHPFRARTAAHRLLFQILPVHWLRRIDPAVHDGSEQSLVRRRRLRQRRVTAFPLQSAAARGDESEIATRRVLELEHRVWPVGIAFLSEHVHQRDGPLPPLGVGDAPPVDVVPIVHRPQRHGTWNL